MADKNKLESVESSLVQRYNERGYLLEDEVIDCCIDHDLDLAEIDAVCDRLLKRNIIFRDVDSVVVDEDDDDVYDRSQLNYDEIYEAILNDYPNCENLVEQIRNTLPPQHKEWRTLIREAKAGNEFARERLICMYLRTILKNAYDFSNTYYCDFEECFQNAVIGLILAVEKYDITSPDSFVSYFPLWGRQVMNRECAIKGAIIRFPVHYKELFMPEVNRLNDTVIGFDAVSEMDQVIIKEHEEKENSEGIYKALDKMFSSFYKEDYEKIAEDKFDYNHILPYVPIFDDFVSEEDFTDKIIAQEEAETLRKNINSCLKNREKDVIIMRYGLDNGIPKTLEEVGKILGVTRERVRQIESRALRKLKIRYRVPVD